MSDTVQPQTGMVTVPRHEHERLLALATNQLSGEQIRQLNMATPTAIVKQVPLRGGTYNYVPHSYFTKRLNEIFRHIWSWEIVKYEILSDVGQVLVHGRLRVMLGNGIVITKDGFGGADIKKYSEKHKRSGQPMDIADDLKGASSDAKKKAASELGIALDVYAPVLDAVGLTDYEITPEEKAEVQKHIDAIKNCNQLAALEMYGDTLATEVLTHGQLQYVRNEYAVRLHVLKHGAGTEPMLAMLEEVTTLGALDALCTQLSEGKHGQFDPDQWKRIMDKAKEKRIKLKPAKPSTPSTPKK